MPAQHLASQLYPFFLQQFSKHTFTTCRLFLAATDMKNRACVRHSVAAAPEDAWNKAVYALSEMLEHKSIMPTILRADWVIEEIPTTWAEFVRRVEYTRRNYFRHGLALDPDYSIAFTEMELNGNAMIYVPQNDPYGHISKERCQKYCNLRFGCDFPELSPDAPVTIFTTVGAFVEKGAEPLPITGQELYAGHRDTPKPTPDLYLHCAKTSADYLVSQCRKSGRFNYGWFTCYDRPVPTYNTLRHISTTWSLLQAYGAFKTASIRAAIVRSIAYIIKTFARTRSLPDGEAMYFEDMEAGELKLGSNGCMLIMLARFAELIHPKKYIQLMRCVARGIMSMQEEDGSFVHVFHSKDYSLKDRLRTVYYDGEAVFGLLRLYSLTKEQVLLDASRKAFDHFIATNHWKNHDHWLSYAVNELTRYDPQKKYFQFGIQNFKGYLSFIRDRDTAYPTLLELILAASEMLKRLEALPDMADLLQQVDRASFEDALHKRAQQLLNGYFWPEFVMFFQNPAKFIGSFFIKHHAFRVRIDDVQHYLSGFIGYAEYLKHLDVLPTVDAYCSREMTKAQTCSSQTTAPADSRQEPSAHTVEHELNKTEQEAPDSLQNPVVHNPDTSSENMLRVGLLRRSIQGFWHPQNTAYAMFHCGKQFGIEMCFFSPDDINFSTWTVNAMFLQGKEKVRRIVPVPRIIDNSILYGRNGQILRHLEERCILIRHSLGTTKQDVYDLMLKDGRFADFLITTHNVDSVDDVFKLLESNNNDVILKPLRGARGIGVARIILRDNSFVLTFNKETKQMSREEFAAFYQEHFTATKHILQPYIRSVSSQGNPFDIRVHCRRGEKGIFKVTPFPRIGSAKGVVSNIASGGYSMKLQVFLQMEYGTDWKLVYNRLIEFGKVFPDYYQSLFPRIPLFDIGVDMGIQRIQGGIQFKIFEVNTFIDGPFFEIEDAITHFDFYKYLYNIDKNRKIK